MKTVNQICALMLMVSISLILSPLAGCNTTPQRAAFNAEQGAQVTIEAAMNGWGDYVAQYHPSAAQEAKVKAAYEKYQLAAVAVLDAEQMVEALASSTNSPPAAVQTATLQKNDAEHQAAIALSDLVGLLRSFNVKI
jgi:hypothetical protein